MKLKEIELRMHQNTPELPASYQRSLIQPSSQCLRQIAATVQHHFFAIFPVGHVIRLNEIPEA